MRNGNVCVLLLNKIRAQPCWFPQVIWCCIRRQMAMIKQWRAESLQSCVSSMMVSSFGLYLTIFRGSIRMKGNAIIAFAWSAEVFSICTIYFLHHMMGFLNIRMWVLAHPGIYLCTVKRENEHNIQFGNADSLQWNRERISLRTSGGQPRSFSWCGGLSGSRWAGVFLGRYAW